jgi:undecaprenyl-diphosphatase
VLFPILFAGLFLILWAVFYAAMPALRYSGRVAGRFVARSVHVEKIVTTARERFRDYIPLLLLVLAGGALIAWAGDAFIDMAERLHDQGGKLLLVDTYVHDSVVQHRSAAATKFFLLMSTVGGPAGVAVILAIVAAILLVAHRYRWLIYLVVTAGGGAALNLELKRHFARTRPDTAEWLRRATGYSFPSGHAMGSTVVFFALAYLAMRTTRSWALKSAALAFSVTFIAAVATSRVYLGVHWTSDVGAGITAGTAWDVVTTVGYEVLRRMRHLRQLRRARLRR